jgi:hypothetical protein
MSWTTTPKIEKLVVVDHQSQVESQIDSVRGRLHLRGPRVAFQQLYRLLPDHMEDGEQLIALGDGSISEAGKRDWPTGTYVVLTDRKLFGLDGGIGPLDREAIRGVSAATDGAFRVSSPKRCDLLVRLTDPHIADEMVAALQAPPDDAEPLDALERLGRLRKAGVLGKKEFEAKKAELLARL